MAVYLFLNIYNIYQCLCFCLCVVCWLVVVGLLLLLLLLLFLGGCVCVCVCVCVCGYCFFPLYEIFTESMIVDVPVNFSVTQRAGCSEQTE